MLKGREFAFLSCRIMLFAGVGFGWRRVVVREIIGSVAK